MRCGLIWKRPATLSMRRSGSKTQRTRAKKRMSNKGNELPAPIAPARTTRNTVTHATAAATTRDEAEMPTNIKSPSLEAKAPDALMSVKDAAAHLGMSEGWIYGSGLPCVKLGRRRMYRRIDLDSFIEQNLTHGSEKRRS